MRSSFLILPLILATAQPVLAQAPAAPRPPAATAPATPDTAAADTVVARVDGQEIRLSDVRAAIAELPPELRGAPENVIFPLVVDQLVTQKSLINAARAEKLDQQPEVKARIDKAVDQELQQALLRREIAPQLTDEALRARYQRDVAAKPGEEEVHARHILVTSEEDAKKALVEARKPGADFAALATRLSTGPGAQQGGDLGFFKKADMVPEFADTAFKLQPGQISDPVRSPFGWHVIKVEERRSAPVPTYDESLEQLRQAAFEEAVQATVARIQASAKIERFNEDGSPRAETPTPSLLDGATPPAASPTPRR
jgi:peptidyl-prolyl cis-trans isomerase C